MTNTLKYAVGNSTLHAVPAVHFRIPFAQRVNNLCRDSRTRPDAIAVELGPAVADYCYNWFKELRSEGRLGRRFPCMLAVVTPNQRIRSSLKERAYELQKQMGRDLEGLPDELLNRILGYCSETVLFLSPTDSIVEAVRAAVELDIPLYGVDMDEVADAIRPDVLTMDPTAMRSEELGDWVKQNYRYAHTAKDEYIDQRREVAMAARLKTILNKHKKVVFTCGLAHWDAIYQHLGDKKLTPAPLTIKPSDRTKLFSRVVAHPSLAVYFMDLFPPLAAAAEKARIPATETPRSMHGLDQFELSPPLIFKALLVATYKKIHSNSRNNIAAATDKHDIYKFRQFETLAENLSILSNQKVPNVFMLLEAARGTIGEDFCQLLVQTFLDYDWLDPTEFGLPILTPALKQDGIHLKVKVNDLKNEESRQFYINHLPGFGETRYRGQVPYKNPYSTDEPQSASPPVPDALKNWSSVDSQLSQSGTRNNSPTEWRTWPPADHLITMMSCRATALARYLVDEREAIPFEGTLYEGIDAKRTLRSFTAGDGRVFVSQKRRIRGRPEFEERSFEPIVWIFEEETQRAEWHPYRTSLSQLRRVCPDKAKFDRATSQMGSEFAAAMTYGNWENCPKEYLDAGVKWKMHLNGVVYFIPPHFDNVQDMAWVMAGNFRNVPNHTSIAPEDIVTMYQERYGFAIDLDNWISAMVQFAIPYTRSAVVVVAPQQLKLDPTVLKAATRLGKAVTRVPLSYFSRQVIERLRLNYGVAWYKDSKGVPIPESVEQILGEPFDRYRNQIPTWLREYGRSEEKADISE